MKPLLFAAVAALTSCLALAQEQCNLILDINPGRSGSRPENFHCSIDGRTVLFSANDFTVGAELWTTDGSTTALLKDIFPGPRGSSPADFYSCWIGNEVITFFTADDGVHGRELWRTNGTEAGTFLIRDFKVGINGGNPQSFSFCNGRLFFVAQDFVPGPFFAWTSDGTPQGTQKLDHPDPNIPFFQSTPDAISPCFKGNIFLSDGTQLWKTDGSTPVAITASRLSFFTRRFRVIEDLLFFAGDGQIPGDEPWVTDGTPAGTRMIRDIAPNSSSFEKDSAPESFTLHNGRIFFAAGTRAIGHELWVTDGTEAGTSLVKDIDPGTGGGRPRHLTSSGNVLYFEANDGSSGHELWMSDGTNAGTVMVQDLFPGPSSSDPKNLLSAGDGLYFTAKTPGVGGDERKLYYVDNATQTITVVCSNLRFPANNPTFLTPCGNALYMNSQPPTAVAPGLEPHSITQARAFVRAVGQGTNGATLRATNPIVGQSVTFSWHLAPTSSGGYLFSSRPSQGIAVIPSLLAPMSYLVLDPATVFLAALTTAPGGSFTVPIPNSSILVGEHLHAQVLWTVNSGTPFETSNAVQVTFGR